jgi:hypothetical protein
MKVIKKNNLVPPTDLPLGKQLLQGDLQKLTDGRLQFLQSVEDGTVNLYPQHYYGAFRGDHGIFPFVSQELIKQKYTHDIHVLENFDASKSKYGLSKTDLDNLTNRMNQIQTELRHEKKQQTAYEYIWGTVIALGLLNQTGILTIKNIGRLKNELVSSFVTKRRGYKKVAVDEVELVEKEKETMYLTKEQVLEKRALERMRQESLKIGKAGATDLLHVEKTQSVVSSQPKQQSGSLLQRIRSGGYKGGGETGGGGGAVELARPQPELPRGIVWRKDKSCKIYQTDDELATRVRERFGGNASAVKYRDCIEFLQDEGWIFVETGKHPKLAHVDFPEILDRTNEKEYYAQFYNKHDTQDDRYDLLTWARYNGKKYGPR